MKTLIIILIVVAVAYFSFRTSVPAYTIYETDETYIAIDKHGNVLSEAYELDTIYKDLENLKK